MEAALLMCDVIGIVLVMVWAGRRRGAAGLFGWRSDPSGAPATVRDHDR